MDSVAAQHAETSLTKVSALRVRAAALAQARAIPVSNHLWPEISAQLLCCTPTAHWLEYVDWWNPTLAEPLRVDQGMANVEGVLGTGVQWNEEAVKRFSA